MGWQAVRGHILHCHYRLVNQHFIKSLYSMPRFLNSKRMGRISTYSIPVYNVLAYRHMRVSSGDEDFNRTTRARKLILIPTVFVLTRLPGAVNMPKG